jgi:hypothetical protein
MDDIRVRHFANGQTERSVNGYVEVPAWRVVWADGSTAEVRGEADLNEILMEDEIASFTYAPLWRMPFVVTENPFVPASQVFKK